MRQPYPVVADQICMPPNKPSDIRLLERNGAYKKYNAHYMPVIQAKPGSVVFYPCARGQSPVYDEYVVFQGAQALPQFWLELTTELTRPVSTSYESPQKTIDLFVDQLLTLLSKSEVKQNSRIEDLLTEKMQFLVQLGETDTLDADNMLFYQRAKELIDSSGKINQTVLKFFFPQSSSVSSPKEIPSDYKPGKKEKEEEKKKEDDIAIDIDYTKMFSLPLAPPAKAPSIAISIAPPAQAIPDMAFGKAQWAKYFGDVGEEPPLPKDIMKGYCPFSLGIRREESLVPTLIPRMVNGKPFTLKLLRELIQKPKSGHATKFHPLLSSPVGLEKYEDVQPKASYWVLLRERFWKIV